MKAVFLAGVLSLAAVLPAQGRALHGGPSDFYASAAPADDTRQNVASTTTRSGQRCYEADEGRLSLFALFFVHRDVKETCKWIMQPLVLWPRQSSTVHWS